MKTLYPIGSYFQRGADNAGSVMCSRGIPDRCSSGGGVGVGETKIGGSGERVGHHLKFE